ncbi:MAG: symmetrical bis(5'-nucleosyl)-tetraphosphatase [Halioglobus sp.]|nr:symmetrical bis(5'-nucleosyl)-tetraphosphatase [Halioglobus sp.]
MATYVIGDIQGCLQPLRCLLEAVAFSPDKDTLWSVGDLVNRGPASLATLRFLYGMRDNLVAVLGNHDLHLLATAAGVRSQSPNDTLDGILSAPDREHLLQWLTTLPLIHRERGYTLVHAGVPPQWTIEEAIAYASEVEGVLRSPDCTTFLQEMYGDTPAQWSDDLAGTARLRVITNYLTRMRYCTEQGWLDLHSKGPKPDPGTRSPQGETLAPWFKHSARKAADETILFGHWASLGGETGTAGAIAMDTGCVWNGALSLLELDSGQWTRCSCCEGGHAAPSANAVP